MQSLFTGKGATIHRVFEALSFRDKLQLRVRISNGFQLHAVTSLSFTCPDY